MRHRGENAWYPACNIIILVQILDNLFRKCANRRVGDGDFLFEVDTGIRNGCVMSTLLFNHVVNWIMRRTTEDQFRGIRWTPFSYLEDLDYADSVM